MRPSTAARPKQEPTRLSKAIRKHWHSLTSSQIREGCRLRSMGNSSVVSPRVAPNRRLTKPSRKPVWTRSSGNHDLNEVNPVLVFLWTSSPLSEKLITALPARSMTEGGLCYIDTVCGQHV